MREELFPKFSVVIPAYNEEAWIERAIYSVKQQDYPGEFEIIVVDNGSADQTAQLASLAGARVVQEKERGLSMARNAGYQAAQGELIAYMDADSFAPPDWLRSFLKPFLNPEIVAVGGGFLYEGSQYHLHRWLFKFYYGYFEPLLIRFMKVFIGLTRFSGANFSVRKSALDCVKGFDNSVPFWGEDTRFVMNIKKVGKVERISYRIYSSARRYNQNGLFKTVAIYNLNRFWIVLFKTPFSKDYGDLKVPAKEEALGINCLE